MTLYVSRGYVVELDENGDPAETQKYYSFGTQTVALWTIAGETNTLQWMLSDHLGSTSIVANADGSYFSELRYSAFGALHNSAGQAIRFSYNITPTDYRYTGQLAQAEIGLYYYGARFYDPALGRFVQADTIIPGAGNPAAWDRYAYVLNNPVRLVDPSGHISQPLIDGEGSPSNLRYTGLNKQGRVIESPISFNFESNGQEWTDGEISSVKSAGLRLFHTLANTMNAQIQRFCDAGENIYCEYVSWWEVDEILFGGPITFNRSSEEPGYVGLASWGGHSITIYNLPNANTTYLVNHPRLAVHEIIHLLARVFQINSAGGYRMPLVLVRPLRDGVISHSTINSMNETTYYGYAGGGDDWQFGFDGSNSIGEEFADMGIGYAYNQFDNDSIGLQRRTYINQLLSTSMVPFMP